MALLHSATAHPGSVARVAVLALAIVIVAVVATMIVNGPSAGLSFGLSSDPATGLWSW